MVGITAEMRCTDNINRRSISIFDQFYFGRQFRFCWKLASSVTNFSMRT